MFDSAKILKILLESLNVAGISSQENRFDAMMVVEVKVLRPHDRGWGFMLHVQDLVNEVAFVMVVDEPDNSEDFPLSLEFFMRRLMTDHGPQSIRTAGISLPADEVIHQLQNIRLDRNTEPPQRTGRFCHSAILLNRRSWQLRPAATGLDFVKLSSGGCPR